MTSNDQNPQMNTPKPNASDLESTVGLPANKAIFAQTTNPRPAVLAGAQAQTQSTIAAARRDTEEFVELEHQLESATTVLIPEGVTINGTINTHGKAAVFVKGEVIGNINSGDKRVYVNIGARVVGMIESEADVYVAGTVENGKSSDVPLCVKTPNRFVLGGTGRVEGDVAYGAIRIYGGVVSGRMMPNLKDER